MNYPHVVLQKGKELPIRNRHHWIFSGAIKSAPKFKDGDIMQVYSYKNELLGHAYFNNSTVIAGRMLNYSSEDPYTTIKNKLREALKLRLSLFDKETNCYRIINGEGDYLPGLIVDRYDAVVVIQIATVGMDRLRDFIVDELQAAFAEHQLSLLCIYEKSTMSARLKDGLTPFEGVLFGQLPDELIVLENGLKFLVDLTKSQKTGLFLDMREMRNLIGQLSYKKKVLNCFAYTGGFSLYALQGGAQTVTSVDIAPDAVETARTNFKLNNFPLAKNQFVAEDAFKFLKEQDLNYDLIILDPPAFAKKRTDIERAKRGYGEINRTTLLKMPKESLLLTCSCSYHVNQELFEAIVGRAARDAKRSVRILHKQRLAMDHPINIHHSEIDYLKSLLLFVE